MKKALHYIILLLIVFTFSCKFGTQKIDVSNDVSKAFIFSQYIGLKTFKGIDAVARKKFNPHCSKINDTIGSDSSQIIEIDFDSTCATNNIRQSGQIIASFNGNYGAVGCVVNVNFNHYTFNGLKVKGNIIYTVQSDDRINFQAAVSLVNRKGKSTSWAADYVMQKNNSRHKILISGHSNGTDIFGKDYKTKITGPLLLKNSCDFVEAGSVFITPEKKAQRIIVYGEKKCDDIATMILKGNRYKESILSPNIN